MLGSKDVYAELDVLQQFQYLVPETSVTHLSSDTLTLCDTIVLPLFSILESVASPELSGLFLKYLFILMFRLASIMKRCMIFSFQEFEKYFAPHHLKSKAMGRPVVMLPLVLFADNISGNRSKKWHKLESWYLRLAGL